MLRILKVMDGKPGHISITDGVIESIKYDHPVEIVDLSVKLRAKFFLQILKIIVNSDWISSKLMKSDWLLPFFYKGYQLQNNSIDFIISAGGDTAFINIWLSKLLDAKNIYCSGLRKINPDRFYLLISTSGLSFKNCINLEIAPAKIGSQNLSKNLERFCQDKGIDIQEKYFVLLIGGDGAGYTFNKKDFEDLVEKFMILVEKNGAKALITTSRRTGLKNEKFLEKQFSKHFEYIAHSVYFNQNPKKVVANYLELASTIFVTEESGSMIRESIFQKKPVFTLSPEKIKMQTGYKVFLDQLLDKQRIVSFSIKENWSAFDLNSFQFSYMEKLPNDDLREQLKQYIN